MDGGTEVGRRLLELLRSVGEEVGPPHRAAELLDGTEHRGGVLGVGREDVADIRVDVQHHQTVLVVVDGQA